MLRDKAAREGQDESDVAASLIQNALEREANDRAEAIQSINKSGDDFAAGRFETLEQFASEKRAKYGLAAEQ